MQNTVFETPLTRIAGPEDISSGPQRRTPASVAAAAFEGMRPHQWLKNLPVFAPLAAAHRIADLALLGTAIGAFIAFSLVASTVYLLNDLKDAPADRMHPHKRTRPIASGRLPTRVAAFAGGFKRIHGAFKSGPFALRNHGSHYGFVEEGVVFSKLQPRLATAFATNAQPRQLPPWLSVLQHGGAPCPSGRMTASARGVGDRR